MGTSQHRLDILIAGKLSGHLDEAGEAELQTLLQRYPERAAELAVLQQYWHVPKVEEAPPAAAFDRMMAVALTDASPAKKIIRLRQHWLKWGAAALVAGLIVSLFYLPYNRPAQLITTADGERRNFRLPDGSIIHLNGGSRLTSHMDAHRRELWLEGEAYFEVAPDAARPFTVHAADMHIRALGTAFNVKAYPEEGRCETTLLQGAVEVYADKAPAGKIRLRPYEKIAFISKTGKTDMAPLQPISVKQPAAVADSALQETAWLNNRLQFDAMNFEELARLLQRWYGIRIEFRNEKVKQYIFSGSFAGESVMQALHALQVTEDFQADSSGNLITIY
ncbi:FecR family protein [Chitinophaga solisilvae]|uniref:FecR family protein n=1 Tax=Chitinophaga solisilvae TaxID=1233460 RepID=UPI00136EF720|nr:FecR family protein [Chitinophaga solisilvae]